jgi:hypothetical protein
VSSRQLLVLVGAVTVLTLSLAWFLERFQSEAFHAEVRDYMGKWEAFKTWEAEHGE